MSDTMKDYLAIRAVSAGVLRTLIEECPAAAWFASAFNPEPAPADDTDASDAGTIIHSILLEGSTECCVVVDPADHPNEKGGGSASGWTNKSIKAEREVIRSAGKIPILKPKWAPIVGAVTSAQRYIESLKFTEPAIWTAFQDGGGLSEQTIEFVWNGVPCKIRPDRISADFGLIVDAKSTLTSANPEQWGRGQMFGRGLYLSVAFYQKGVALKMGGDRPAYVFLVVSQTAPYLCSLVALDPAGIDLAQRQIAWAIDEWSKCVTMNNWPGYANRVSYIETPPWLESQWLGREMEQL